MLKIAHDGCFDDLSAVINMCSLYSMSAPCVKAWKLIIYSSGQLVLWDQRAIAYSLFLNPKIAVMHWSEPKSFNELVFLSYSLDLGLGANDLPIETPFAKAGCLQWFSIM